MQDIIFLAIDVNTSFVLAIFSSGMDCHNYCEANQNALQVPFNAKHHPDEARKLFVGEKFIA